MRTLTDIQATYVGKRSVVLKVLRNGQPLDIKASLYGCPEHLEAQGAYASPILLDGTLAPWGQPDVVKELVAGVAGEAGGKLAGMAAQQAASRVPMVGGILSGAAKQAATGLVNAAFTSKLEADQRFHSACELGKHLADNASRPDFPQVMAAVNLVYENEQGVIAGCMGTAAGPVDAVAPAAAAAAPDLAEQLEKLTALHSSGALSDAEFQAAKAKLLGL